MSDDLLLAAADALSARLRASESRIVLAESCTGGLAAATLARIPGISAYFCGSAVVYRNATKTAWLGVSARQLDDESVGPVSSRTASDMARGVLSRTPEAHRAASITGHLGPDAPEGLDGIIFIGIATRNASGAIDVTVRRHVLNRFGDSAAEIRRNRQRVAACQLLTDLADDLDSHAA